jgi:predicted DNA-binding transcriptional regulator YafY
MGKRAVDMIARQKAILEHLRSAGETTLPELEAALGYRAKTIGRDLDALRAWGHAITETRASRPGRGLGPSLINLQSGETPK